MLVGEVRWATTGFGSSWKLSGGRKWSSGPTKVSKKRQVRRAVERRICALRAGEQLGRRRARRAARPSGRPAGRAPRPGANGAAIAACCRAQRARRGRRPRRRGSTRPPCADRPPVRSRARPDLAWAAVIHSRRRRRVRYRRTSVRTIASAISHAWWARKVMPRAIWVDASAKLRPTLRMWVRFETPDRPGIDLGERGQESGKRRAWPGRTRSTRAAELPGSAQAGDEGQPGGRGRQGPAQVVERSSTRR